MVAVRTFFCLLFSVLYLSGNTMPFAASSFNYDIIYHRISLSVDPTGGSRAIANGSVTTYFKTTVANVSSIQFDIDGAMTVSSATYHGSGLTKSQNTTTDILTLTLPPISAAGTLDSVTVFFSGSPALPSTGIPSGYNVKLHNVNQWAIYTLDEAFTAHYWWPCKETLYDKIDSVDLIVTTPVGYKVAGNGVVTEAVTGSNRVSTWKTRYAIATYGINFAVADYQNYQYSFTTGGKTLQVMNYFYAEDNNATYHGYADQLQYIIPAFANVLGVDYPFLDEKYGLAECTGNWGALEVQSMTFMAAAAYADNGYTLAHEAAHQWFGDMVTTNSWQQVWLNEGFAQYFESIIYAEKLRTGELAGNRTSLKSAVSTTSTVKVSDTADADKIFNASPAICQPYQKGAMLISMLRTWVGDAGFFSGLRDYLMAPGIKYGFGSVDSLKKYMQLYTPFDLANFFSDWTSKQGYANYAVSWTNVGKRVIIKLQQSPTVGGAGYFDMPVPIRITNNSGFDTTITIIDKRGILYNSVTGSTTGLNTIAFDLSAVPANLSYDPNDLVLGDAGSITINTALPVQDIYLSAVRSTGGVNLSWKVTADRVLKEVVLQKSSDGTNFTDLRVLSSTNNNVCQGTGSDQLAYGLLYYRLKLKKEDGGYQYSKVQVVNGHTNIKADVIPNPVSEELNITVPATFLNNEFTLLIRNAAGQTVNCLQLPANSTGKINVQVSSLPPGMYWASLQTKNKDHIQISFVKK